jgi:glucose-1-phosphate adenylyltransferase
MSANDVLGIIFSNAYDEVIPELTALRTMGSVPYAGRYRLIDFPLSSMVNAGITKVGVITNNNYRSLMDHIGNGKPWDLSRKREGLTILPPFSGPDSGMFKGKADALYGSISYISDSGKDYVLLTDCNVLGNIDYEDMLRYHIEKKSDMTLAYAEAIPPEIKNSVEYTVDDDGRITESRFVDTYTSSAKFSLKVMIIGRTLLERLLHEANAKRISDFEDIVAPCISQLRVYGYRQESYVKVISSIRSYYDANLDLLNEKIRNDLFPADLPIYTKISDRSPTVYGINSAVGNSLVADGCKIDGEVENCIIFRGVTVAKGAKVKNSIIMQDTVIGEGAAVDCVIADKDVRISTRKTLSGASNYPVYIGKGIVI